MDEKKEARPVLGGFVRDRALVETTSPRSHSVFRDALLAFFPSGRPAKLVRCLSPICFLVPFCPIQFVSVTNSKISVLRELDFFPWRAWVPPHSAIVESGRGRPFRGVLGSLTSKHVLWVTLCEIG